MAAFLRGDQPRSFGEGTPWAHRGSSGPEVVGQAIVGDTCASDQNHRLHQRDRGHGVGVTEHNGTLLESTNRESTAVMDSSYQGCQPERGTGIHFLDAQGSQALRSKRFDGEHDRGRWPPGI